MRKIFVTKSWFFETTNKIEKSLGRLLKEKEKRFNFLKSEIEEKVLLLI